MRLCFSFKGTPQNEVFYEIMLCFPLTDTMKYSYYSYHRHLNTWEVLSSLTRGSKDRGCTAVKAPWGKFEISCNINKLRLDLPSANNRYSNNETANPLKAFRISLFALCRKGSVHASCNMANLRYHHSANTCIWQRLWERVCALRDITHCAGWLMLLRPFHSSRAGGFS